MNITFSIIIPYNSSLQLLIRAIKSIPVRNDTEIIIINDGVTDNFDFIYTINSNCRLIQNNSTYGAGYSRNKGISFALGKWIFFVDSDDYFTEEFEKELGYLQTCMSDIVFYPPYSVYSDDLNKAGFRHLSYEKMVFDVMQNKKNSDILRYQFTPPWSKAFNRNFLLKNNLFFEEIMAGNDMMFSVKSGYLAEDITVRECTIYVVTVRIGSLVFSRNRDLFFSRFDAVLRVNKFLCTTNNHKHQISVLNFLYLSIKYGLSAFFSVIYKIVINKSNVFVGMDRFVEKAVNVYKHNKNLK